MGKNLWGKIGVKMGKNLWGKIGVKSAQAKCWAVPPKSGGEDNPAWGLVCGRPLTWGGQTRVEGPFRARNQTRKNLWGKIGAFLGSKWGGPNCPWGGHF